ncbi:MAG: hypothetical protein CHACPFDD_03482 [Phycisphaerae bacterium]|nr:hypothetical protein [Phycisphaerae bacterium]
MRPPTIPRIRCSSIRHRLCHVLPLILWAAWPASGQDTFVGQRRAALELPAEAPLRLPTAVSVSEAGLVAITDGVNDRVVVVSADGRSMREISAATGSALSRPVSARFAADGSLWICDTGNARLVLLGADLQLQREYRIPAAPDGRPADPTDVLPLPSGPWVVDNDNHRILALDPARETWRSFGQMGESLGQFQYPFMIAALPGGDVAVTDVINGRGQILSPAGEAVAAAGSYGVERGELYRPGGIAVDGGGNVWIADSVVGVIQAFRPNGAALDVLRDDSGAPLRFEGPLGLSFGPDGALYVVELRAARVAVVDIGASARALPRGPAQRTRSGVGQQARACTICHLEWMPPFVEGRDTELLLRPSSSAEDPLVARSESCLSCHDSSVADSRHRVWEEHGHRTDVAPPPTMTVPRHLPLVEGKLACRTCHSAHGQGPPEGHLQRAVVLRVPNVASQLCVSCHTDKTRGPRFGTHPTGGMPWPVPQQLIAAGAKVGPNPRELTCQTCHTPHGASHEHLLVMGADNSQLCLTCHDQMRPGMFRGGGPTEHPVNPPVDAEQLAAIHEMGTRVSPDGRLICLSCHKLHEGKGERFMLADDLHGGQICLRCHSQRAEMIGSSHDLRQKFPDERNRLGMTVTDGGPCSACHLFHRYAREPEPTRADPKGHCTTCHQQGRCAETKQLGSVNHPHLACVDCHNPHDARHASYLPLPPQELCAVCHSEQAALAGGSHDAVLNQETWKDAPHLADLAAALRRADRPADRCLSCHRPHGDDQTGLFRVAPVCDSRATDAACLACHRSVADDNGAHALQHPVCAPDDHPNGGLPLATVGGKREIGCSTCHNPHASPLSGPNLVRAAADLATGHTSETQLCLKCHSQQALISVTSHDPAALAERGWTVTSCQPCHSPHGPADAIVAPLFSVALLGAVSPDVQSRSASGVLMADAADRYCIGCHRPNGPAPSVPIASHPALDMRTIDALPVTLPLYDEFGHQSDVGRITCRTCHLPHGGACAPAADPVVRSAQRAMLRPFTPPNTCTTCHGADGLRRFLYFHDPQRRAE